LGSGGRCSSYGVMAYPCDGAGVSRLRGRTYHGVAEERRRRKTWSEASLPVRRPGVIFTAYRLLRVGLDGCGVAGTV
jgi:hypothetical protein